jgi:hypothetical protein
VATTPNQSAAIRRRLIRRATLIVRHGVLPVLAAAFETYQELEVTAILDLCAPALADRLCEELRLQRQQLIEEIRARLREDTAA